MPFARAAELPPPSHRTADATLDAHCDLLYSHYASSLADARDAALAAAAAASPSPVGHRGRRRRLDSPSTVGDDVLRDLGLGDVIRGGAGGGGRERGPGAAHGGRLVPAGEGWRYLRDLEKAVTRDAVLRR